jgi:hypothetical protein
MTYSHSSGIISRNVYLSIQEYLDKEMTDWNNNLTESRNITKMSVLKKSLKAFKYLGRLINAI